MRDKVNWYLIISICSFVILYALISFVNHYHFRTYALDLGAYTNALYDYCHLTLNDSTVFKENSENLLADHFDIYLFIFSPLSLLFKSYTLLIVQVCFILLGGIGVSKYINNTYSNKTAALWATIYFYMFFGIFSAISFDYHSNVIAAMIVPWLFLRLNQQKYLSSIALLIFILIGKENMSLWMFFVCIGLVIKYRDNKKQILYCSLMAAICIIYFLGITFYIMPALSNTNSYPHFEYSALGSNPQDALIQLFTCPAENIRILFTNHTNHLHGDYVKTELHIFVFLSGLFILFRKPYYLIMLIPIYFQKLFHDNYAMWGISGQYNIEFAPIFALGIFSVICEIKKATLSRIALITVLVLNFGVTIRLMDNTIMYTNKAKIRFYQSAHYTKPYDINEVHKAISNIPPNAVISSQSPFLPHLAYRDKIYQFPIIKDAQFIVYSDLEKTYPLEKDEFLLRIKKLENNSNWKMYYENNHLSILRKI